MSDSSGVSPYEEDEDVVITAEEAGVGVVAKVRVPAKKKAGKRGRKSFITSDFWSELRGLYESGDYSQRELSNYASSRGINLSQSLIARQAVDQGWVKGSRADEIRDEVHKALLEQVGENIRKMLEEQRNVSKVLLGEVMMHLRLAGENRKGGLGNYVIPAALLRQLISGANEAMVMEARAMGFDIKTGRPFTMGSEEDNTPTEMIIKIHSAMDDDRIRADSEKAYQEGLNPDGDRLTEV